MKKWWKPQTVLILLGWILLTGMSSTLAAFNQQTPTPLPPTPTPPAEDLGKPTFTGGAPALPIPLLPAAPETALSTDSTTPVIDVWYDNDLRFGHNGDAQRWVNIMGNVDNVPQNQLEIRYRLNGSGGFQLINEGPDKRRLALEGDFNVEIEPGDLIDGTNSIEIRAKNNSTNQTVTQAFNFTYDAGNTWPLPYTINWSTAASIPAVAQVVDGDWAVENGVLKPQVLAYDRLVAFGDDSWDDYEVSVPITIHGIDSGGFAFPSGGPGIGIILRWPGHRPETGVQPSIEWRELGALGWYRWSDNGGSNITTRLEMIGYSYDVPGGGAGVEIAANSNVSLATDVTYIFKMNVRTTGPGESTYRFRVWQAGQPEPTDWQMVGVVDYESDSSENSPPESGSAVLVSHHVDASFGNVTVQPLSAIRQTLTTSVVGSGAVQKSPNQADYEFGETVTLTAVPDPGYVFVGWSGDVTSSLPSIDIEMDSDKSVTAEFAEGQYAFSDDTFNSCTLNPVWSFIDPDNDGSVTVLGDAVELFVGGGSVHDMWDNNQDAVRISQPASNDGDLFAEVKFDSIPSQRFQLQGLVLRQDNNDFMRFDFSHDGSNLRAFSGSIVNGSASAKIEQALTANSSSLKLRVAREGNLYTMQVNVGSGWETMGSYTRTNFTLNSVEVFAGNAGSSPQPFTAVVDYATSQFFAGGEDDMLATTLSTNVVGTGSINVSPASYGCGDTLTLTAVPGSDHRFTGWSGAASGSVNPTSITFDVGDTVTATFKQEFDLTINVVGQGSVTANPETGGTYLAGDVVQLTAVAADNWSFAGWSGGQTDNSSTIQIVMNSDKTITATFIEGGFVYLPFLEK